MEIRVITNKSTKTTIAADYKICTAFFSKALGLMFSQKKNLIFVFNKEKRISLHMLFVFFPVDALYLNDDKKILEIKHMKPFRPYYRAKNKTKYVLELTEKHDFKVGDKVKIKDNEIHREA